VSGADDENGALLADLRDRRALGLVSRYDRREIGERGFTAVGFHAQRICESRAPDARLTP